MIPTPNLGLKLWNLSTDPYDSGQLAGNWQKVDEHNHALGKGVQIPTGGIADGAVTNAKLAPDVALGLPSHHATHEPGGSDPYDPTKAHITDTYTNRPAAGGLNGVRFFATDKLMEWQSVGGAWVLLSAYAPGVLSLPGSPVDAQECKYVAGANGETWHLRYNGGTSKWDFVGGSALYAEILTQQTTSSATYTNLGTTGPSIALPLAGDYDVTLGAQALSSGLNNSALQMSYAIGGTGALDVDGLRFAQPNNAQLTDVTLERTRRKTGLTAVTLTAKYKGDAAATAFFSNRMLRVIPVRVS